MDDEQYLHFKDHQWAFDPTLRPFDNTTSRSSRVIAVFLFPYGFAYFIRLWGGLLLRFFFIFIIILQWMGQRFNRGTLWWIKGLRVWHQLPSFRCIQSSVWLDVPIPKLSKPLCLVLLDPRMSSPWQPWPQFFKKTLTLKKGRRVQSLSDGGDVRVTFSNIHGSVCSQETKFIRAMESNNNTDMK